MGVQDKHFYKAQENQDFVNSWKTYKLKAYNLLLQMLKLNLEQIVLHN